MNPIKSIRTKLFISFTSIFVIFVGAICLLWYQKSSQTTTLMVSKYAHELIKEANNNFELMIKDTDYLCSVISLNQANVVDVLSNQSVGTDYQQLQNDRKLNDFISSISSFKNYISSTQVIGWNHKRYSWGSLITTESIIRQSWYRDLIHNRTNRVFVKTHSVRNVEKADVLFPDQNIISVARTIANDREPLGVVIVDIQYEIVRKIFSTKIPQESTLFVIDQGGDFIYHPDIGWLGHNIKKTKLRHLLSYLNHREGSLMTRINHQDMYLVYYKSDYTHWTTIGMISKKSIINEAVKTTRQTLFISIISLIIVILAGELISYTITKHIYELRDAMKQVGQGNLNTKVSVEAEDEIGELSRGFNKMVQEINQLLTDAKLKENQKRQAQLQAYQAQINPHFLSNTLNTVRWLADLQKAENISSLVTSLIQLLQVSMNHQDFITIRQEINYLKDYLNIQEYRFCDKFKAHFEVDEAILEYMTPKFILQPLVENALIHGIEPMQGQGLIIVKGYLNQGQIMITITDNGVGIPSDKLNTILQQEHNTERLRFSSIGIYNVNERLKLYFGDQFTLQIESVPGLFTTVTVCLPVHQAEGE